MSTSGEPLVSIGDRAENISSCGIRIASLAFTVEFLLEGSR
jgi:hypothetical protein